MVAGTVIPTKRREQVKARERMQCARCPGIGVQWHHRRSRKVRGDHRHCSCNGVWLCHTCHTWVHSHPELARIAGFIVSSHELYPGSVPVLMWRGRFYLDCEGRYQFTQPNGENDHDDEADQG